MNVAGGIARQPVGRVAVEMVDERVDPHPALAVVDLAVGEEGAALDVEGTDAGVDHPLGAGEAAGEHQLLRLVGAS